MPHHQDWLNAPDTPEQAQWNAERDRVFEIQNEALRVSADCDKFPRSRADCEGCGNIECVEAWEAQNQLWPEAPAEERTKNENNILREYSRDENNTSKAREKTLF